MTKSSANCGENITTGQLSQFTQTQKTFYSKSLDLLKDGVTKYVSK